MTRVRHTECLRAAVKDRVGEPERRRRIQDTIAALAEHSDEVLGRWADVMLNADGYADVIDRHVELASGIAWVEAALDKVDPPDDARRWHRSRANPAIQLTANDEYMILERLVTVTQLAERLDRRTLDLAERLVPARMPDYAPCQLGSYAGAAAGSSRSLAGRWASRAVGDCLRRLS